MITIPCALIPVIRPVFRRALNLSSRGAGPDIQFVSGPDGLRIRAQHEFAAVEHHTPGEFPAASVRLPMAVLADCRGGRQDSLTLRQEGGKRATAQWTDKQIPQLVPYDVKPSKAQDFPSLPDSMSANDAGLWSALAAAVEVTDPDALRYALGCVQLRGAEGKIVATDSRQLLVQAGYSFPWEDDLLVRRTTLFGGRLVEPALPLSIGRSDDWLTLQSGPWTFHLKLEKEGRFPKAETVIPRLQDACCRVQLDPEDAAFLADALQRLPPDDDNPFRVITLDLSGQVVVRAATGSGQAPMEILLSRSAASGEQLRLATDRNYLARAIRLGFRELHLYGADVPVQATGDRGIYLWALLGEENAIGPSRKAVRIDSAAVPARSDEAQTPSPPPSTRRPTTMATAKSRTSPDDESGNGNGSAHGNGSPLTNGEAHAAANGQTATATPDLIEQAEALRSTLRTGVSQLGDLITALKQQKKSNRNVQSALAALRQLEGIAL